MATVLCTGVERSLIMTRVMILESAGHSVVPAAGVKEIIAACAERKFDIAVIGQVVNSAEKLRIFHLVRKNCPQAKILELYSPHTGKVLKEANAWLEVPTEIPSNLAEHVGALAGKKKKQT